MFSFPFPGVPHSLKSRVRRSTYKNSSTFHSIDKELVDQAFQKYSRQIIQVQGVGFLDTSGPHKSVNVYLKQQAQTNNARQLLKISYQLKNSDNFIHSYHNIWSRKGTTSQLIWWSMILIQVHNATFFLSFLQHCLRSFISQNFLGIGICSSSMLAYLFHQADGIITSIAWAHKKSYILQSNLMY